MERRGKGGRKEPITSILKKPKDKNLLNKKLRLKSEKGEVRLQGCSPLMYACQQADYKGVVDILNKDPSSVNARDRSLRSALHYCGGSGGSSQSARANCADRILMASPGLVDAKDADGLTPLHLAVVHGNVPLVQTLLAGGADLNAKDNEHHTVVHWATVCGEVGALRAVLAAGADPATPDQHGGFPLHYAAQMCGAPAATDHQSRGAALEVLRALVREGGANVDVRDADGRTPLLWAASAGSAAALLALHQAGAKVDDADRDGLTALHCASARGHTEALETLIGLCGARVDVADTHGCTPLHYAVALGHADSTAALLQHGADSHRQDKKGRSPAHTAAAKGQIETVRMLGARGANLWLRNSKGDLPLHEAVASGRRELVKWLLDGRPSQVNATNHEGKTPLHIAATTDNADLCRLLLDRGAEPNPVAWSSRNEAITPLDSAMSRGHRTTAKYLQMHGGLPASKLANTEVIIDGAAITSLPTRRVTNTKIDVRDRIRIEKNEIVELSSPLPMRRRVRRRKYSDSSDDTSGYTRTSSVKWLRSKSRHGRSKMEQQRSFSDGYDTELEGQDEIIASEKKRRKEKKSRSRSEPPKKDKKYKQRRKYKSSSESSSETDTSSHIKNEKKTKRNKKYSSSDNRSDNSRKQKFDKTSIHIDHEETKQSVSIIKCTTEEKKGSIENVELETNKVIKAESKESPSSKTEGENEIDALSVKTNMVVTEAQIHVERESSQHGNSELTVTLDSANNVSIEATNMNVEKKETHENEIEEPKQTENIKQDEEDKDTEVQNQDEEINSKTVIEEQINNLNEEETGRIDTPTNTAENKKTSEIIIVTEHDDNETESRKNSLALPEEPNGQPKRKRSFEIISGPEETNILYVDPKSHEASDSGATDIEIVSKHDTELEIDESKERKSSKDMQTPEVKRKVYASTTASSGEVTQSTDKGAITVLDGPLKERLTNYESSIQKIPAFHGSPKKTRVTDKENEEQRKNSIYENESYKVLSDIASANELGTGILKKSVRLNKTSYSKDSPRILVPSVSDNEVYNHSEINERKKRLRKKSKGRSRTAVRSKSENSERGYESSGFMDSGLEPSPRFTERRIMSPRLAAYYRQRNASAKNGGKFDSKIPVRKPGDRNAVDMTSVTQRIQTNMRRYYCERKIFQHLLELKRLQIRSSKTNEAMMVKRAIDEYNMSSLSNVGLGPYSSTEYTFSSFEKFLYDSLRKMQKSGKKHLDNLPEKPFDFDYGESELYKMTSVPDNPCLCTNKTHRCFHAVHAYTGIPCSAYIPHKWNHHTMPKPKTANQKIKGFLPKISCKAKPGPKAHVTLEVSHGTKKQLIALPAEKLDRNKKYYVTFTVKGSEQPSDDNSSAKGVKSD